MYLRLLTALSLFISVNSIAGDFYITLGGFYAQTDTTIEVGTPIFDKYYELDLESDLALKEEVLLPYFKAVYEFNSVHAIYFDWRSLHRDSYNEAITEPFVFEGHEYQAGAAVALSVDIDIARIGYTYSFFENENWDLDLLLGLHIMRFDIGMSAAVAGRENDDIRSKEKTSDSNKITAPLPNFGALASFKITPDLSVISHLQFFALEVDSIGGYLLDASLGAEYEVVNDLFVKISYDYYEVSVGYGDAVVDLNASFEFYGPMAALTYHF